MGAHFRPFSDHEAGKPRKTKLLRTCITGMDQNRLTWLDNLISHHPDPYHRHHRRRHVLFRTKGPMVMISVQHSTASVAWISWTRAFTKEDKLKRHRETSGQVQPRIELLRRFQPEIIASWELWSGAGARAAAMSRQHSSACTTQQGSAKLAPASKSILSAS